MANIIRHKRGTSDPSAGDFSATAEFLVNTSDGGVFTKTDGGSVVEIGAGGGGSSTIKCACYKDTTGNQDYNSTSDTRINVIDTASSFNDSIFSESNGIYTVSEAGIYEIQLELGVYATSGSNYRYTAEYACRLNSDTGTVLALAQDGYIRRSSGADESQMNLSTIESLDANDDFRFLIKRISTQANGNARSKVDCSRVLIKKLA